MGRTSVDERCDLCAAPIPQDHRHVFDAEADVLRCACRPCSMLFEREAAGAAGRHYRLVPDRRVRLESNASPQDLDVPVGLAFFVRRADGTIVARYPSPMGTTTWEVDPDTWSRLEERLPIARDMQADVEALLLHTARGADERWLVPLDDCYRLVAAIKRTWRGLSGGPDVWPEIARFFEELNERAGRTHAGTGAPGREP